MTWWQRTILWVIGIMVGAINGVCDFNFAIKIIIAFIGFGLFDVLIDKWSK